MLSIFSLNSDKCFLLIIAFNCISVYHKVHRFAIVYFFSFENFYEIRHYKTGEYGNGISEIIFPYENMLKQTQLIVMP